MPLQSGSSRAAFEHNVRTEIEAGRSQRQALAIAYSKKGDKMSLSQMARDCLTPAFEGPEKLLRKFSGGDATRDAEKCERCKGTGSIMIRGMSRPEQCPSCKGTGKTKDSLSALARDALLPEKDLVPGTDGLADLVERVRGGIRGQVGDVRPVDMIKEEMRLVREDIDKQIRRGAQISLGDPLSKKYAALKAELNRMQSRGE